MASGKVLFGRRCSAITSSNLMEPPESLDTRGLKDLLASCSLCEPGEVDDYGRVRATDSVSGFGGPCAFRKYLTSCDSCVKLHKNLLLDPIRGSVLLPKAVSV